MIVYRVAKSAYISDLTGAGNRIYGSRWAPPGVPVLYASENRALAVLEFSVHLLPSCIPSDVAIATIEIPDFVTPFTVDVKTLPPSWKDYPAPPDIQTLGKELFASGYPILKVPSVIVPYEFNIAIHTEYPGLPPIRLVSVKGLSLDRRLIHYP